MKASTRPVSPQLKVLRGTLQLSRLPKRAAGERLSKAPSAPATLSALAADEWRELAPVAVELGVLTRADLRAFGLLCQVLATESELRVVLKTEGLLIAGVACSKAHPATKLLESTRNQAIRMLDSFGLTPRGRQSVDMRPRLDDEENAWDKFLKN